MRSLDYCGHIFVQLDEDHVVEVIDTGEPDHTYLSMLTYDQAREVTAEMDRQARQLEILRDLAGSYVTGVAIGIGDKI